MIPAQFDPATLAIWTTTNALENSEAEIAATTMRMAADGLNPSETIGELPIGDPLRSRLIWLASTMWHEKRHYLDTCLTNYGARRFRNLFNLSANIWPLLAEAKKRKEPVWFPVEVYGYPPLVRKVLGIPEPPINILQSAKLARSMKDLSSQLDAGPVVGDRSLELGGEAQLEGLAQVSQTHSIEHCFGFDDLREVVTNYLSRLPLDGPYRAIEAVALTLGSGKQVGEMIAINPNLAAALFITALCGRYFGVGSQPQEDFVAPWPRLARMLEELGPKPGRFEMSDAEVAELVDKAARRLWGRTAFEEIAADIDAMEEKADLTTAPWLAEGGLHDAWLDFLELRRRLLAEAQNSGPTSLLPRSFPIVWRDRLRPWHVVATPDGKRTDNAPVVFGAKLNLPSEFKGIFPSDVSWAQLYAVDPDNPSATLAPRNREAWLQMLERNAPFALLMLNGRLHRRMVPPEFDRALADIKQLGITVRFHPRFEWPEQRDQKTRTSEAMALAHFSGRNSFICDITGEGIDPVDAAVLTPWEFRQSKLLTRFREAGIFSEIMLVTNWSDWVVRRDLLE